MNQISLKKNVLKSKKFNQLLNKVAKRTLDIGVSSVALIAVSPILIYTAYKIKKEDDGPILFKQQRSGENNIPFEMYKFRSMKVNNTVIGTHSDKKEDPFEGWSNKVPDDFVFKTTSG